MKTNSSILGILGAAAAGVAIGMLFAPDKGTNTRKKLAKKGKDYSSELRDKFGNIIESASKKGIKLGVHTLSNFLTTNDPYATPIPVQHLLKQGVLSLTGGIDDTQTTLEVAASNLFDVPVTLNALQIGNELITFGKFEKKRTRIK